MKAHCLALFALSACTQAPPAETPTATAQLGELVTEIDPRIWCIHQTSNGDYWFGSNGNGAYRFDGTKVTHYSREHGLCGDAVRNLYEDSRGHVLIATTSGISRFDGERLETLEFAAELTKPERWVLDPKDLWMVFDPGVRGPVRYDGERLYDMQLTESPAAAMHAATQSPFSWDPADIYSIYKDRRGHLWFGTAGSGLCRYDGKTIAWMYEEQLTTTPRGGAFGIRSVFEDRAGHFWICNTRHRYEMSRDVATVDGHTVLQYKKSPGLPDAQDDAADNFNFYPSMIEDDAGALWMACGSDGVWKYGDEGVTKYSLSDGSYACRIFADDQGKLWVGTIEHGIYVLDGDRFEPFAPPSPSNRK